MNCNTIVKIALLLSTFAHGIVNYGMAATIAIDARHGDASNLATGADFEQFRATIVAANGSLMELSSFTDTNLTGIDALILRQSPTTNTAYSADEINAIQAFVNRGYGLLLLGEAGFSTSDTIGNFNSLA